MFKRELKANLKSFLIWTGILVALFLLVFLMYPTIMSSESGAMIDELVTIFPEEVLIAFNMDIASMTSAFGWLKTEGMVLVLLILASYSGILGSNILLKEESDKTIEYLNSLPVSRAKIVTSKVLSGLIYIVLMVAFLTIFNFIGLSIVEDFDKSLFIKMSITPLLTSIVTYFLCMFVSTFTHKTKKMIGISMGIVMVSYMLQVISTMFEDLEFLKYLSTFSLADMRNVITEGVINPVTIVIAIATSIILYVLTLFRYDRKELV